MIKKSNYSLHFIKLIKVIFDANLGGVTDSKKFGFYDSPIVRSLAMFYTQKTIKHKTSIKPKILLN
jgi:hypothetical protein